MIPHWSTAHWTIGRRVVLAHRGASAEAPENTLPAFALAESQGADALEIDVRLTADGVVVVHHDRTIDRTTNLGGEVVAKAASYAMRILGAYGYSTEYPVARFYRDAPTYFMVEGSANICKMIIALDQLGYRKANR